MKYIKGFGGLGLVALGGFIGWHFRIGGGGNAALLGGILACLLYYSILRFGPRLKSRFWPGSAGPVEQNGASNSEQERALEELKRQLRKLPFWDY